MVGLLWFFCRPDNREVTSYPMFPHLNSAAPNRHKYWRLSSTISLHANNWRKPDPPPALQGDFSNPKEQLMFSKPWRNLQVRSKLRPNRVTFESVTRHTLRKRQIGVIKTFAAVTKLNLGWSFRSLLTCSLPLHKNNELRIHFFFPCSVTFKLEFSQENLVLIMARIWQVLICLLKLIPMSQLNYSIL